MDSTDELTPYKVVQFFQLCLGQAGNPIEFTRESGLPAQLAHARRLIAACKCDSREIRVAIRAYCADSWWVEHQPDLAQVVKQLDRLRAAREKQVDDCHGYAASWEDL